MKLVYGVKDRPRFSQLIVLALQQILAIMAATLVVPAIINGNLMDAKGIEIGMSQSAALFGAGVGTVVYLLFTRFKSPVFLGSSFAFIGSMTAAFTGAASVALGYVGIIIGAAMAGLVYVVIAIAVKLAGTAWIGKLMPAVVIGPTVALIGLSLAGSAVSDVTKGNVTHSVMKWALNENNQAVQKEFFEQDASVYACLACALVTLAVVCLCATFGRKMTRLIPFIIGILSGYALATVFTVIGNEMNIPELRIINFSSFKALAADGVTLSTFISVPDFTFLTALGGFKEITGPYLATVAVAYVPVAFVVFAEHLADHKNISSIIESNLLEEPGLHRTLLGDGVGSVAGAVFGGCPNTTYGESVGCVAITGNASVVTILAAAIGCMIISFLAPFVAFLYTVPSCVMGGVCMALYGFIAVSGLKMIQKVDLEKNKNLFVVSVILISGIGGLTLTFGAVTLTTIAVSLILGILMNLMLSRAE